VTAVKGRGRQVLWWSRADRDYSRDRIVRQTLQELGWSIQDFRPYFSSLGHIQAQLQKVARPDLVWVPCFRHRDAAAAARWARSKRVPVVFDPLISTYDKKVFEKEQIPEGSAAAAKLQAWESKLILQFDSVVADTQCHAEFYADCFRVPCERLKVIPVGAEEGLFQTQPFVPATNIVNVLFYGSFIGLQGPEIIAQAAGLVPEVHWTFLGHGPLLANCQSLCGSRPNVTFLPWVPYETLPAEIGKAHILLGVFGSSAKAGRVIPNKVYQALACGRVVVTQPSKSYPPSLRNGATTDTGVMWIPPGNPQALAEAVRQLAQQPERLVALGAAARNSYEQFFSGQAVRRAVDEVVRFLVPEV
jgi:glycosyltransferase involved in cell wall biosynthesis